MALMYDKKKHFVCPNTYFHARLAIDIKYVSFNPSTCRDSCATQRTVREHARRDRWRHLFTTANEHVARRILSSYWLIQLRIWVGSVLWRANSVRHVNSVWKFPGKSEFRGRALERVNRIPSFIRPFPEAISGRVKRELRYFLIRCICLNAPF